MSVGPIRTCVGCRERREQRRLVRVANSNGILTVGRSAPGRGAYVCPMEACVKAALDSGRLRRALRFTGDFPGGPDGLKMKLLEVLNG